MQELEYEKLMLEQRQKTSHQRLYLKNSISNKAFPNKSNEKLFLSSLQILINQGLRELNSLKRGKGIEEDILKRRNLESVQNVLDVLKEKFSSDICLKGISVGGELMAKFENIFANEDNEQDLQRQVDSFRSVLEESSKYYQAFIKRIQEIIEGNTRALEDKGFFDIVEKTILEGLLEVQRGKAKGLC